MKPTMPVKSRRRRLVFRLMSTALIALLTFLLLELALRLLPFVLSEPQASFFSEAARIPISNTRMYDGVAIALPPTADAEVLVVGDSVPFGSYVSAEETFPARLQEATGMRVINLSVGSMGPHEYNRM